MIAVADRVAHAAPLDRRLSVAPMMERTDRHLRWLLRLITRRTLLYTEMIPAAALVRGPAPRLLAHDPRERPLAAQLGGSEPEVLAAAARRCHEHGFDEVNLNVGCPSPRVSAGGFGASLMLEPDRVAECVAAMRASQPLPVTVKTRIGVDDRDRFEDLLAFVDTVAAAGCATFTIHARKAWLDGPSPRANRRIPPLRPDRVEQLKRERPDLEIVMNGGIISLDAAVDMLARIDGAMIGRAACDDPWMFAGADERVFGERPGSAPTRSGVALAYLDHLERERAAGVAASVLVRPLMGLFHGRRGARRWRRALGELISGNGLSGAAIARALAVVEHRDAC